MKTLYYTLLSYFFIVSLPLQGQDIVIVTDEDLQSGGSYTWTAQSEYHLNGLVVLEEGATLTIEAGTVIKGIEFGGDSGDEASALIIARGAQIFAEGTSSNPIIFTTILDDLQDPFDLDPMFDQGWWGGLIVLGNAPLSEANQPIYFPPLEELVDERFLMGGNDATDNSGVIRYVSIRHAGDEAFPDIELPALGLGGQGSGTTIDHVEVHSSFGDGVSIFGGTVSINYLAVSYCLDDAIDIDLGFQGTGQFWLVTENGATNNPSPAVFLGDRLMEVDGADTPSSLNYSRPNLANLTFMSLAQPNITSQSGNVYFKDKGGGLIRNSLFVNLQRHALTIADVEDTQNDSYQLFQAGELAFVNNVWNDQVGLNYDWPDIGAVVSNGSGESLDRPDFQAALIANNEISTAELLNSYCYGILGCFDPLPLVGAPILTNGQPIEEDNFQAVSFQGAFGNENWMEGWTFVQALAEGFALVKGNVRYNPVIPCTTDPEDVFVPEAMVSLSSDGFNTIAVTDQQGDYQSFVPEGNLVIRTLPPNDLWQTCVDSLAISTIAGDTVTTDNLFLAPLKFCAAPTVNISAPFLRRCFESTYFVTYSNKGTETATNLVITVVLDPFLNFIESSVPIQQQSGDTLSFIIPNLAPFEQGTFSITVLVSCDAELGQEHCTQATITASNECSLPPGALLITEATCDGDSVRLQIINVGDAPPTEPVPFIVIEDEVMLLEGTVQPGPGEIEEFVYLAEESTFHISTLSTPDSTQSLTTSKTISCISSPQVSLNSFPGNDEDPFVSQDCQNNIGAFDPNDKYGSPVGIGPQNIIPRDLNMQYRIRFQNTGTDTAFNVVIVDTLSDLFDLTTLRMGAFSHPMEWELEGCILKVRFSNIMLPDSNINEPLSHGFFKFRVDLLPGIPYGTALTNEADIYFDFNEPIRTNQTFHLIDEIPRKPTSTENLPLEEKDDIVAYPQPAGTEVFFQIPGWLNGSGTCEVLDLQGRRLRKTLVTGPNFKVNLMGIPSGVLVYRFMDIRGQLVGMGKFIKQ